MSTSVTAAKGASTDQLRKVLKASANKAGEGNLEEHLQKLFNFLILHYPGQALDKFEEASHLIKHGKDISQFMKVRDDRDYSALVKDLESYTAQMQKAFAGPQPEEEGGDVPEVASVGYVADLLAHSKIWQWAGIGFGEQETYRLQKSLKTLAGKVGASSLTFFGKITGTERDYYIAEGQVEAEEEGEGQEQDADFEPKGTGVNKFTYFVSSNSLSEWTKLPDLTPKQVLASRQVKVLFSGNLDRQIFTNPYFDGQEKHYLRAQIARIAHSTTLIPKGIMRPVEDSETRDIEDNTPDEGEIVMPNTSQMKNLNMWVHGTKNILKNGTTSLKQPEAPEGEEWDEDRTNLEMKSLLASDPYAPLLSPISDDAKIAVSKTLQQNAWTVRIMGDATEYQSEQAPKKAVSNGVAVVRSLQWPGAYSFYSNGKNMQLYVGNGHKYEQHVTFYPVDPPLIESDPSEYEGPQEPEQQAPVVAAAAEDAGEDAPVEEDE